ncbi:RodZ family helix-turn-helix domain-containing protein [Rhizobium sp. BT-226]|uniref:helix-turn-helix domain-containing protein n=1 Tax=Rhizobium sp. BT-226 TaxID=2986922 RepID=UPI0021F75474|nr:helix-turn-helix transcriptional regulator [Rhizobium sp. BT-226]MCW0021426.1 helix-turn-helix transcriptional regulator [Rhizobium sp. BT-226]
MQNASLRHASGPLENADAIEHSQGSVLRHARLAMGYSLDDLAETTGLTVSEIDNIESDAEERPDFVKRLASVLGVQVKVP